MIKTAGFLTANEDEARSRLQKSEIKDFAVFTPNDFVIIPRRPASVVVRANDMLKATVLLQDILIPGVSDVEEVDDDYFDWHAPYKSSDWDELEQALLTWINHQCADLKKITRGTVATRLNARLKTMPGIVEDGFGRKFCYVGLHCQEDDLDLFITHENGDARCSVFVYPDRLSCQIDEKGDDTNLGAMAKWLMRSIPAPIAEAA